MSTSAFRSVNGPGKTLGCAETAKSGIWVAIAAITMSFAAFTSAMIVRQGSGDDWHHIVLPPILYLNTIILLASSGTIEIGRRSLGKTTNIAASGELILGSLLRWIYVTLVLGLLFVAGQWIAWRQLHAEGLYLATAPTSSFFYLLTVLHVLHVLGGLAGLVYVLHRLSIEERQFRFGALNAAIVYWHFLSGLWVYLLLVLRLRL